MLCSVASCKLFYSNEQGLEILSLLFVPPTVRRRNGDYYETFSDGRHLQNKIVRNFLNKMPYVSSHRINNIVNML